MEQQPLYSDWKTTLEPQIPTAYYELKKAAQAQVSDSEDYSEPQKKKRRRKQIKRERQQRKKEQQQKKEGEDEKKRIIKEKKERKEEQEARDQMGQEDEQGRKRIEEDERKQMQKDEEREIQRMKEEEEEEKQKQEEEVKERQFQLEEQQKKEEEEKEKERLKQEEEERQRLEEEERKRKLAEEERKKQEALQKKTNEDLKHEDDIARERMEDEENQLETLSDKEERERMEEEERQKELKEDIAQREKMEEDEREKLTDKEERERMEEEQRQRLLEEDKRERERMEEEERQKELKEEKPQREIMEEEQRQRLLLEDKREKERMLYEEKVERRRQEEEKQIREEEEQRKRRKKEREEEQKRKEEERERKREEAEKREREREEEEKRIRLDQERKIKEGDERENMLYEDELSWWNRKALSEMQRRHLKKALPALHKEDTQFLQQRIKNCESRVEYLKNRVEEIKKELDKDKDISKDKKKEREKEKKKLEAERVDLKLTLFALKRTSYRRFYDRDAEEKFGSKIDEEIYKAKPKTGEEEEEVEVDIINTILQNSATDNQKQDPKQAEDPKSATQQKQKIRKSQIPINFDQRMQLLSDDSFRKIETEQDENTIRQRREEQRNRWKGILSNIKDPDELDNQEYATINPDNYSVASNEEIKVISLAQVMAKSRADTEKKKLLTPEEEDQLVWDVLERGSDMEDNDKRKADEAEQKRVKVEQEWLKKWKYLNKWEIPFPAALPVDYTQLDLITREDPLYKEFCDDSTIIGTQYVVDAIIEYKPPDKPKAVALEAELRALIARYKDAIREKNNQLISRLDNELLQVFTNRSVVTKMHFLHDEELIELLMSFITERPSGLQLRYVYTLTLLSRRPDNHTAFLKFKAVSMLKYLVRHINQVGVATLAVAEGISYLISEDTIRPDLIQAGALSYMSYVLRTFGRNDQYIARYATMFLFQLLQHEEEIEGLIGERLPGTVELLINLVSPKSSPTEDVLRMGITTLQKIATRSNRPNDPITRIRKDTKQVAGPPPELLRQQTKISGVIAPEEIKEPINADQEKQLLSIQYFDALVEAKAPSVILAVIRENMDAYIDVTQNCVSILWQMASHTQFHSADWLVYDPIQILYFVHPLFIPYYDDLLLDSDEYGTNQQTLRKMPMKEIILNRTALYSLHNSIALNTLYLLCFLCEMRPLDTLPILAELDASVMLSNIIMRLPDWNEYDNELIPLSLDLLHQLVKRGSFSDGINKSLLAQKLVTTIDSYNHTHVGGREVTPPERQGIMTNCMGLLAFLIDNDPTIATNFPTIEAARAAMTGMKLQYASQELGDSIMYQANQFVARGIPGQIAKSQSSAYIKLHTKSGAEAGSQLAQPIDEERPVSQILDMLYYGSKLVLQLLYADEKINKKMIGWDGIRVFALISKQILDVTVFFYNDRFNLRLSKANFARLKDPVRLAQLLAAREITSQHRAEYRQASIELAREALQLSSTVVLNQQTGSNEDGSDDEDQNKDSSRLKHQQSSSALTSQSSEKIKMTAEERKKIQEKALQMAKDEGRDVIANAEAELQQLNQTTQPKQKSSSISKHSGRTGLVIHPLSSMGKRGTQFGIGGQQDDDLVSPSSERGFQYDLFRPKQRGPTIKDLYEAKALFNGSALNSIPPIQRFKKIAMLTIIMRRFGMVDESYWEGQLNKKDKFYEQMTLMHKNQRQKSLIRRASSQIPESPKSSRSIKEAQLEKGLLAQQQQKSKQDLTQTQQKGKNIPNIITEGDSKQKNVQPSPRSNPQLTPSLNTPVPLTPNASQKELIQDDGQKLSPRTTKTGEEAPTQEESKWKCELKSSYMTLLATCPQLAVKERAEETIEVISECMYTIAKRLPPEAKQKIVDKDSPIAPTLFDLVKRYSTSSKLLTTQNTKGQGQIDDDNKEVEGQQQEDCGGANCDRAQIIVENILNCLRHMDVEANWSLQFKTARHQAKQAFPNSRLFKK